MNKSFTALAMLALAMSLMLPTAKAANLDDAGYNRGRIQIDGDLAASKTGCASLAGNANRVCIEEANGKAKVSLAELEYARSGKPIDQAQVLVAKAESTYAVSVQKCEDFAGNVKDICVEKAKAAQSRALVEARLGKQASGAAIEASPEVLDADYKVAVEQCDTFAGQAKAECLANAKVKFTRH